MSLPEQSARTVVCSIVFMDIIGASKVPADRQLAWKDCLNGLVAEAIDNISEDQRLILDTGDGVALCFFGDPEHALFVGRAVNRACLSMSGDIAFQLRTGINLGSVKLVSDLNGRPNAIGDGINVAERIMSFAERDEVLVSRSYYEVVARLGSDNEQCFRSLGTRTDKHAREHEVYAYGQGSDDPAPAGAERAKAADTAWAESMAPEFFVGVEERLSAYIGPLGPVIVQRAVRSAASLDEFRAIVSAAIPDTAQRALFLEKTSRWNAASGHRDAARTADSKLEEPAFSEDQLQQVETLLADHVGPLAGILVKDAAQNVQDRTELARRLANHIEKPETRVAFLNAMGVTS